MREPPRPTGRVAQRSRLRAVQAMTFKRSRHILRRQRPIMVARVDAVGVADVLDGRTVGKRRLPSPAAPTGDQPVDQSANAERQGKPEPFAQIARRQTHSGFFATPTSAGRSGRSLIMYPACISWTIVPTGLSLGSSNIA